MENSKSELCLVCNKKINNFIEAPDNDKENNIFYKIYFCLNCEIGFIPKLLIPDNLNEDYESLGYYSEFEKNEEQKSSIILLWLEKLFYKKRVKALSSFKQNGNLLDVGCGSGKFLTAASPLFENVYGIEVSVQGQKLLKIKKINFNNSFFETKYNNNYFDAITFWHSFEHMNEPETILYKTHQLLKTDGILLISVPNYNSIGRILFNKNWFHLDAPRHIFHYTENSLKRLLYNSKFEVIYVFRFFPEYDISGIIQSLLNFIGLGNNILKKSMKYGRKQKNLIKVYLLIPFFAIPFAIIWIIEILLKRNETFCIICKPK